jgi:hypothetical protein
MKSRRTQGFRELLEGLPQRVQQRALAAYRLFQRDPYHNSLHFKLVHDDKQVYSVRVGLHYRALGRRRGDEIIWFWIGTHADYDKLIEHL